LKKEKSKQDDGTQNKTSETVSQKSSSSYESNPLALIPIPATSSNSSDHVNKSNSTSKSYNCSMWKKKKGTNAPLLKIINLEKNILQLFFGHLILELVVATFLTLQK